MVAEPLSLRHEAGIMPHGTTAQLTRHKESFSIRIPNLRTYAVTYSMQDNKHDWGPIQSYAFHCLQPQNPCSPTLGWHGVRRRSTRLKAHQRYIPIFQMNLLRRVASLHAMWSFYTVWSPCRFCKVDPRTIPGAGKLVV